MPALSKRFNNFLFVLLFSTGKSKKIPCTRVCHQSWDCKYNNIDRFIRLQQGNSSVVNFIRNSEQLQNSVFSKRKLKNFKLV